MDGDDPTIDTIVEVTHCFIHNGYILFPFWFIKKIVQYYRNAAMNCNFCQIKLSAMKILKSNLISQKYLILQTYNTAVAVQC